jgi:outer membrane murein-binding lipoprotein Lpp
MPKTKNKKLTEQPKLSKTNRLRWLILASLVGVIVLGAGVWFISWEMGREQRSNELRSAAPLLADLAQKIGMAISQTQIARHEMQLASDSQNLDEIKLHDQRFVNVLVGEKAVAIGKRRGDYVPQAGNPGDGHGILVYLEEITAELKDGRLLQATSSTGASSTSKLQQVATAVQNANADLLGSQVHAKAVLKADNVAAARQDIQKALGWIDSTISDTAQSDDPQTQTLYFAQARLQEIAQVIIP